MASVDVMWSVGIAFLGALAVQVATFFVALKRKRVDIVDVTWGISFLGAIVALLAYKQHSSFTVAIVDALVIAWAVRLSSHLYARFRRSQSQDRRYTELMKTWPKRYRWVQIFFKIFVLQALLATLVFLPVIVLHTFQPSVSTLVIVGVLVWTIGFVLESVADWQLKRFLAHPNRSELMTEGLWRYSRHPNYFGEVTMWWGIALIACTTQFWWLGMIGALTITILIRFVSGVPLAEVNTQKKKGWKQYERSTNALLPGLPRGQ